MTAQSSQLVESILDLATDRDRLAHLPCGIENERPDEPTHALCGHPLIGVEAPREAPHCPACDQRLHSGGGGFAALLGMLRCNQHAAQPQSGARP